MRGRQYFLAIIAIVTLALSFGNQILITDSFSVTLQDGSITQNADGCYKVYFPGRSSNWTLNIELEVSGGGIDIVVTIFHMFWKDYISNTNPNLAPLFEAFGVTEINVTLMLELEDFHHVNIITRRTLASEVTMTGHIVASCIYERGIVNLFMARVFRGVSIAVFGLLVIDFTVGMYKSRVVSNSVSNQDSSSTNT